MPASIGVNLRVTGHCRQGGRKYMEDFFSVAYQQTEDERDLEYAFFGIYDGHGGAEAAEFAKERLMETIVRHRNFWSDNDEDVLRAIKMGYLATHYAMWKEQENWPRTASGLPSTAGTTASIAFIRRGKIYVGHVGDSAIVLGYQEPGCSEWKAKPLTRDHKPECANEMSRIQSCGGKVVAKSGVARVVWNRPRIGHKGPVRRSTPIDEIPFLAVARSLGDLWSYNSELDAFVVSPDPDCSVVPIDTACFRCLIFGTDGLFNMLSPHRAVAIVQQAERHNEESTLRGQSKVSWVNPSKCLVEKALEMWSNTKIRADNTSVVTLMLDPPGPPRAEVLRNRRKAVPDNGLRIVTRYPSMGGTIDGEDVNVKNDVVKSDSDFQNEGTMEGVTEKVCAGDMSGVDENKEQDVETSSKREPLRESLSFNPSERVSPQGRIQHKIRTVERQQQQLMVSDENEKKTTEYFVTNLERRRLETLVPYGFFLTTVPDMCPTSSPEVIVDSTHNETDEKSPKTAEHIQINEVSSSSNEISECDVSNSATKKPENPLNLRPKVKLRTQPFRRNRKRKRSDDENDATNDTSALIEDVSNKSIVELPEIKRSHREVVPEVIASPGRHNLRVRKMTVLESVHRRSEAIINMMDKTRKKVIENSESVLIDVNALVKKGKKRISVKTVKEVKEKVTKVKKSSSLRANISKVVVKKGKTKQAELVVKRMNKENQRRNVRGKIVKKESGGGNKKGGSGKKGGKSTTSSGRTLRVEHLKRLRNHVLLRSQKKS